MTSRSRKARLRATVLAGLAGAGGAAAFAAAPAAAVPVTVPNSCFYAIDGFWRDMPLTFDGTAAPASVPPGGSFSATGATAGAELPGFITQYGFNFGLLKAGENTLPATVWVALAGGNTTEAPQVRRVTTTASTTITADGNGAFVSATPIRVTIPIADTFWTGRAAGPATVAQAGGGSIGPVQVLSGATVTPKGSVFIEAQLPGGLAFQLDCQPGAATAGGSNFTPGTASPFATATVDPGAPSSGITRTIGIASKPLRARTRTLTVPLSCTSQTTCRGVVSVTTRKRVKVGRTPAAFVRLARARYTILPGRTRALKLSMTAAGRRLMASRASVAVTVLADPVSGPTTTRRVAVKKAAS
ncbi:MAG: hypothetical protein AB7V62_15650 [Thermoleophilia bacterium]